jgi:hypothetical protein
MPSPDKTEYAKNLFQRLSEGVIVPLRRIQVEHEDGIWLPDPRYCHRNASILASSYPNELEAVRGWLYFDFRMIYGDVRFMHHSVVKEKSTGRFFDPTPQERLNPDYLFIESMLSEDDYSELVEAMEIGELLSYSPI